MGLVHARQEEGRVFTRTGVVEGAVEAQSRVPAGVAGVRGCDAVTVDMLGVVLVVMRSWRRR